MGREKWQVRLFSCLCKGDFFASKSEWKANREFLPLTDTVVRDHLSGKLTAGVYPLLTDERCWFLAADFDKTTWRDDALAFQQTCIRAGIPAYLERSRSGRGAHVWIFFEEAAIASLARKLGAAMLTRTMEGRHHIGLDSYDRFFPNQDTIPQGGFGNLIAFRMSVSIFTPKAFSRRSAISPERSALPLSRLDKASRET
jgi:hypothetical protein